MQALTERQRQILRFIEKTQEAEGMTPTFREIAAHFRFRSPNGALAHVQALRAKGWLKQSPSPGRARSLQVVDPHGARGRSRPPVLRVPIYGSIPAGLPEDATQTEEGCVLMD